MARARRFVLPAAVVGIALSAVGFAVMLSTYTLGTCVDGHGLGRCWDETVYAWDPQIGVSIVGAVVMSFGTVLWRIRGRSLVALAALVGGFAVAWWPLLHALIERVANP